MRVPCSLLSFSRFPNSKCTFATKGVVAVATERSIPSEKRGLLVGPKVAGGKTQGYGLVH